MSNNPMTECPLCGRQRSGGSFLDEIPNDPTEIQNMIENLEHEHVALREEQASMLYLEDNRDELCPFCMKIVEGINGEQDRGELENRINQGILQLEQAIHQSHQHQHHQ